MKCPKCGKNMVAWKSGRRTDSWECPCGYEKYNKSFIWMLKKEAKECKEWRNYIHSCGYDNPRKKICSKSGEELTICSSCHVKQCDIWYKLGKKDARKSKQ